MRDNFSKFDYSLSSNSDPTYEQEHPVAAKKKRSKKYAAVVALAGEGKVTKKQAKTHLSDFIESVDGEILWVIPVSDDVSKPLSMVSDFLWEEEARYVLVTDEEGADEDWTENAESVVEADEDIYAAAIAEAGEADADDKRLIIILDEDSDDDVNLVEAAMDAGLSCYDLTSGLAELDEVVEEDDDEEDAEEEAEPEDADEEEGDEEDDVAEEIELPAKTQKLFDKGDAEGAALKLAEEFSSNDVRKLADQIGVEYEKGVWAKTIAKDIIEKLTYEEEPEEEVEPEPEEKPKKKSSKKASKPEPEVEAEPEPEDTVAMTQAAPMSVHPEAVLNVLTAITNAHDLKTAKDFYKFAKDQGLIG